MDRSENAISETDKKYGRYCHYIAFGILQSEEDAKECVNDAYFRVWNAIPPHQPICFKTFLGKITRGLALNRWEKLAAKKRRGGQVSIALDELAECIPDTQNTEDISEDIVIKDTLNRFLDSLPSEARNIFVRRYWYLLPIKEIAKEYRLSENKVAVILFRTRKKLKDELEKEGILL